MPLPEERRIAEASCRNGQAREIRSMIRKKVSELSPGDVLYPTGNEIAAIWQGVRTPSRCHTIMLVGREGTRDWKSNTRINVQPKEENDG